MNLIINNIWNRINKRLWLSHYKKVIVHHRRILPDYKCIFIHIPKTGGDSIAEALYTLPRKTTEAIPPMPKHAKAVEIQLFLGSQIWEEYFSFTFVRNPWDLMVSSYNWWLQSAAINKRIFDRDVKNIIRLGTFTAFLHSEYGRTMINEYKGDLVDWYSENGEIIVDFIGRFESLQEDWDKVCRKIGVEPIKLLHVNPTRRTSYQDYYTDETRQIVAERFKGTIEMFGYEF